LAGLFDGDGSIGIRKTTWQRLRSPGYQLQVYVDNTDKAIVEWVHNEFGGCLSVRKRGRWKDIWRCMLVSKQAAKLLETILAYLRVKKRQAEIGLEFQRGVGKFTTGYHHPLPREEVERRERLFREMRALTKRGK